MMDLSESLRLLAGHGSDLCFSTNGLRLVASVAGVAFLAGLRGRLEQPLRLLQQRDDRLEASVRAGVAANHQVANAVMAAALQVDALAQRAKTTPLAPGLEQVCQQLSRIGMMVTEVRNALSAPEDSDVEGVEWRLVVEAVAARRGLVVDLSEALPLRIMCVQGSAGLERVLDELADNVPAGATARVEVRQQPVPRVCIAIVDDGPGLTLSDQSARAPFTTGRAGSAGLGLFVVDCLAKASGAQLEVRSHEQGGTFAGVHFLEDPDVG